nr:hypothetical protein [Tanacetum cinerariifolium]
MNTYYKDSNPIYELRPTIAERRSDWYKISLDFFIHYIPRTRPIRPISICDDYLQNLFALRQRGKIERKDLPIVRRTESSIIEISIIQDGVITELNARVFKIEAIIQVLARERNGGVASTICLSGSASLDLHSDEDVAKEYIVQAELRLRIKEKERVRLKEQKMMEEDNRVRLEREKMLRLEEDKRPCYGLKEPDMTKLIKDVRPWVEDLSRRYSDMNTVHLSDAFDLFLGKPGLLISTSSNYYFKKPSHCGMLIGRDTLFHGAMLTRFLCLLMKRRNIGVFHILDIGTGVVTFYDSGQTYEPEWREWYIKLRQCLQVQLPDVLEQACVFEKKGINPSTYSITFCNADNVPKQWGSLVIVVYGLTHTQKGTRQHKHT